MVLRRTAIFVMCGLALACSESRRNPGGLGLPDAVARPDDSGTSGGADVGALDSGSTEPIDAQVLDAASQDALPSDVGQAMDATPDDSGPADDTGPGPDVGSAPDIGSPEDVGSAPDIGFPEDMGVGQDVSRPDDTGTAPDDAGFNDALVPDDAGSSPADVGVPDDASVSPSGCSPACAANEFCDFPFGDCNMTMQGTCRVVPQICNRIFMPVCGCDGNTYGNDCNRQMSQVVGRSQGACP